MSTPASTPVSFDARPLTEPVDRHAVNAFAAQTRAQRSGSLTATTIIGIVIAVVAAAIIIPSIVGLVIALAAGSGSSAGAVPLLLITAIALGAGFIAWGSVRARRITRYRLSRFAAANHMTYQDQIVDPGLPGMIFSLGSARVSKDLVRGQSPRFVEFGNYQYTVKSGKSSTTYKWGYVAVKLDVPLPNIVLDALGNNSLFGSNLPASFRKDQRLSLEGDFDRYFTLYCPPGYERDALYLFTPDIMARFIDNAAELDVEIVDDWMFLYTRREVSTLDPATWAWLFGVVGALITKFDQWARWRDERLRLEHPQTSASPGSHALPFAPPAGMLTPPPGVAHEGRRLKRSTRWVPIVMVVVFGVFWIWTRML